MIIAYHYYRIIMRNKLSKLKKEKFNFDRFENEIITNTNNR